MKTMSVKHPQLLVEAGDEERAELYQIVLNAYYNQIKDIK